MCFIYSSEFCQVFDDLVNNPIKIQLTIFQRLLQISKDCQFSCCGRNHGLSFFLILNNGSGRSGFYFWCISFPWQCNGQGDAGLWFQNLPKLIDLFLDLLQSISISHLQHVHALQNTVHLFWSDRAESKSAKLSQIVLLTPETSLLSNPFWSKV